MAKLPIDAEILPPSNDRIFKALLTHPDAPYVLASVVSAVIERPVESVQVRNTELPVMDIAEKAQRLDVNCAIVGGDQVDVEMHSSKVLKFADAGGYKNFVNKYIYYATDLHSSQSSKSKAYVDFVRTYQVTFCSYTVFPNRPDFVNRAALRFPDGGLLSDQINMVIVELSKLDYALKKPAEELTPLEAWSLFFRFADNTAYRNYINDIITLKEEVGMASAVLQAISKDEHERALLRSQRMYETDMESDRIMTERIEARLRMEGRMEGRIKVAKNLLATGMSVEVVVAATELTVDDILKLQMS